MIRADEVFLNEMRHGQLPVKPLPERFHDPDGQYEEEASNRPSAHPTAPLDESLYKGPQVRERLELQQELRHLRDYVVTN